MFQNYTSLLSTRLIGQERGWSRRLSWWSWNRGRRHPAFVAFHLSHCWTVDIWGRTAPRYEGHLDGWCPQTPTGCEERLQKVFTIQLKKWWSFHSWQQEENLPQVQETWSLHLWVSTVGQWEQQEEEEQGIWFWWQEEEILKVFFQVFVEVFITQEEII